MVKGIEGYHKASIAGDYIQLPKGKYNMRNKTSLMC